MVFTKYFVILWNNKAIAFMALEFVKILDSKEIPLSIKDLYFAAFPEEERRPWEDIAGRIDSGDSIFNFYVLKHNGEKVGFVTLWHLPGALYCEHFAVSPERRGGGIGAETVAAMKGLARKDSAGNPMPLVLEVELPEVSDEAARRVGFYERCGMMSHNDFPYWQPPYRRDLPEVPTMLMSSGEIPDRTALAMILHTVVYNQ